MPLLMDHVLVDIDSDVEDTYFGNNGAGDRGSRIFGTGLGLDSGWGGAKGLGTGFGGGMMTGPGGAMVPVPIEAKLRSLGVKLLYEVCRVQKLSLSQLSKCKFPDFFFLS